MIEKFKTTFNGNRVDQEARDMFAKLKKPEICDALESVRFAIYQVDEFTEKKKKFKNLISDVLNTIDDKEIPSKKMKIIDEFYDRFEEEMMRKPTKQDIIDNLADSTIGIDSNVIDLYIKNKQDKVKDASLSFLAGQAGFNMNDIEMGMQGISKMKNDINNEIQDDEIEFDNTPIEVASSSGSTRSES